MLLTILDAAQFAVLALAACTPLVLIVALELAARADRADLARQASALEARNRNTMTPARAADLASRGYTVEIDAGKRRAIVRFPSVPGHGVQVYRLG